MGLLGIAAVLAAAAAIAAAAPASGSGRARNTRGEFTFVQMADPQLGFSNGDSDLAPDVEHFRAAVAMVNRLKPAFVLISGDLINKPHDPHQTRVFWQVARDIGKDIPVYLVPGNHDLGAAGADDARSYTRLFGPEYYEFHCQDAEFIVLSSTLIRNASADPTRADAQRRWLEKTLAKAAEHPGDSIFVCTHDPWFISGPAEKDQYFNMPAAIRADYLSLLKRYGVKWALAGHLHRNSVASDGSLTMVTTGAVSKMLDNSRPGLRVFHVRGGQVEHHYVDLDNPPAGAAR